MLAKFTMSRSLSLGMCTYYEPLDVFTMIHQMAALIGLEGILVFKVIRYFLMLVATGSFSSERGLPANF